MRAGLLLFLLPAWACAFDLSDVRVVDPDAASEARDPEWPDGSAAQPPDARPTEREGDASESAVSRDGGTHPALPRDASAPVMRDAQVDDAAEVDGGTGPAPTLDAGQELPGRDAGDDRATPDAGSSRGPVRVMGPSWIVDIGLTSSEYQERVIALTGEPNYMPMDVSCYDQDGEARYVVVWEPITVPFWAKHELTAENLDDEIFYQHERDLRTYMISACEVAGVTTYNAIFLGDGVYWAVRYDTTFTGFQTWFEEWGPQGFSLLHIGGYTVQGEERYVGVWGKVASGPPWHSLHGYREADYAVAERKLADEGFVPVVLNPFYTAGEVKLAVRFEQVTTPWKHTRGKELAAFVAELEALRDAGFRPRTIRPYFDGQGLRFAATASAVEP